MTARRTDILSPEEIAYLHELQAETAGSEEQALVDAAAWLTVSDDSVAFLSRLEHSANLELQAGWNGHRLRFPLRPKGLSDNGEVTLEIGVPEVLEDGETPRSWRAPLGTEEIRVFDSSGLLDEPRIVNLSCTGMAIEHSAERMPDPSQPLQDLRLCLPGQPSGLSLRGHVVRLTRVDDRRIQLGIRFEALSETARAQLGRYLFDRHQSLRQLED